jgi:hypothetical protein
MNRFIPAFAVLVLIGGITYTSHIFFKIGPHSSSETAAVEAPYIVPALTQDYKNTDFNFELSMPEDFKANQMPKDDSGASTVVLQNTSGDGIQITVTPFDEDLHQLTADRIREDVPDLTIAEPQPVEIGANDTGLAFKSDNQAFAGASREVWFVFRGNFYQISTYDRLDPLLKSIFATWKFF